MTQIKKDTEWSFISNPDYTNPTNKFMENMVEVYKFKAEKLILEFQQLSYPYRELKESEKFAIYFTSGAPLNIKPDLENTGYQDKYTICLVTNPAGVIWDGKQFRVFYKEKNE